VQILLQRLHGGGDKIRGFFFLCLVLKQKQPGVSLAHSEQLSLFTAQRRQTNDRTAAFVAQPLLHRFHALSQ